MNKTSKIIIGIMGAIIVCLSIIIVILLNKLDNNGNIYNVSKIDNRQVKNAIGIYYSENYRNYRNSTLKLNKDLSCEYPNENVNCKWSISDDEITLTITKYLILDDEKYTREYYTSGYGVSDYTKAGLGVSKESCEEQITREQNELNNARCELVSTKEEKVTLVNGGVLFNNHKFNKIK